MCQGFSHFSAFLCHFISELPKLATTCIRVGFLPEETFLPGQRKKHGFFRIFPLSSGRKGRMGSMIRIEKAMGYE